MALDTVLYIARGRDEILAQSCKSKNAREMGENRRDRGKEPGNAKGFGALK